METIRQTFRVDREEINYLRVTIESYDGMAILRTIDPQEALIELQISPGCEGFIFELLDYLVKEEGINLAPISLL
ncbi:MAG: DUF4911 domain-containing protein [Deltaproteobacteria bacterium]|nr:DUF4911 domain-containing protein [Deltaproteobacteria bacterium]